MIHHILQKEYDLACLKLEADNVDIDKLEKMSSGLNSLKSKVDKLDVDKLVPASVDLKKLSDIVEKEVVKKAESAKMNHLRKLLPLILIINLLKKQTMMLKLMRIKDS